MLQLPLEIQLDDSARFENYFPGANQQLYEKLIHLSQRNEEFLYIWGDRKAGKSHLAQAICLQFSKNGMTAIYLPLKNSALKPEILEGLESFDLICIDEFETIAGRKDWETSIFDLFNRLKENRKQLVIFSQLSTNNIQIKLKDLLSRLNSMEGYLLRGLDDQQRLPFIVSIGKYRGLDISTEVAQFILARTNREIDYLVDLIKNLDKQSLTHQRKITIPFIKNVFNL